MQILLQTARLRLRRFKKNDGNHLYKLDNDAEVMRFINGGEPTPRSVIEYEILPRFMAVDADNPLLGFWAAEVKISGEFGGWFSIRPSAKSQKTLNLGYRLVRQAWGKGYATEGARFLIDKVFSETEAMCVIATTYEKNVASRRVMEKVGMVLDRRFRFSPDDLVSADTFYTETTEIWEGDDVAYKMTRADWEKGNSPFG